MVVAMSIMYMMKAAIHYVVNMIAMRYCFVTTIWTVHMFTASVHGRTSFGVGVTHFNGVFVIMALMRVM